jgi:hypothetical protein
VVSPVRRAYLLTRGFARSLDYRFLGASPPVPWWTPLRDRDLVNLERSELIAYGDGTGLGLLLSGIPSARRDVVGTPIRYTLVVDDLADSEGDTVLARRLVLAGLRDEDRRALGSALDAAFDQVAVDGMLSGALDTAPAGDVVAEVLAKSWDADDPWHPRSRSQPDDGPAAPGAGDTGSWAGPAGDEQARRDFLARVAALAAGGQGFAFTSGTLTTEAGVTSALAELRGSNAVLLTDGELTEVVRVGKDVMTRRIPQPLTRPVVLAGTGGALLIAITAVLLLLLL